jgi:hypothetical protein
VLAENRLLLGLGLLALLFHGLLLVAVGLFFELLHLFLPELL